MMRAAASPQALKELVPGLIKKIGITDRSFQVMTLLEREIQKTSPGAVVVAYKNGKIYTEVESSVHLFELNLKKREFLKVLAGIPGLETTELRFFLRGNARPSAEERLRNSRKNFPER